MPLMQVLDVSSMHNHQYLTEASLNYQLSFIEKVNLVNYKHGTWRSLLRTKISEDSED